MLDELAKLAEDGRLKNFTELAEAVLRIDETVEQVDDNAALYRVARLLDSVFGQAYRGEKSMAFLADRVNSVAEVLDLMAMEEPGGQGRRKDKAVGQAQVGKPAEEPAEIDEPQPETPTGLDWDTMYQSPNVTSN